jgi:hypothetical protein
VMTGMCTSRVVGANPSIGLSFVPRIRLFHGRRQRRDGPNGPVGGTCDVPIP